MMDQKDPFEGLKITSGGLGRFLCKQGFHSWQFLWMNDVRMPALQWSEYVCTIGERCRRQDCRILRTRKNAKIPKRVRV